MKKLSLLTLFCLLFCTLFLTACGSKSTKENGDADIEKKIIGKWMQTEIDGKPAATNDKTVTTFQSSTKAISSSSRDNYNKDSAKWSANREYDVKIDGKKVTITSQLRENVVLQNEFNIKSISDTEMVCDFKHSTLHDGVDKSNAPEEKNVKFVKVDTDYSKDIIGTWEGKCTSEDSVFDDGQEHRWEYKEDGTYVYYSKDGDDWKVSNNELNEYFADGTLLCTRWTENGQENREWWEITINGDKMNWTALRENEDGSTFTATFEMNKVK